MGTSTEYSINSTRFVRVEVCAVGKQALWRLPKLFVGYACYWDELRALYG
jgi:hypothetical protein